MSEKKLKISLDLDDKAFVQAIKNMQNQLNQIQSGPAMIAQQRKISQYMQSQGLGGLTGVSPREQEQAQRKANQESDKVFQTTVTRLNTIKRLQAEINKELAAGLATEKRKADLQERLSVLGRKEKEYTGYATAGMAAGAGGGGGIMSARGGGLGGMDPVKSIVAISGAVGTAFAATALAQQLENVRRSFAEAGYRAIEVQSKSFGQPGAPGAQLASMFGGRGMEEFAFRGERQQAHEHAQKEMEGRLHSWLTPILRPRQTLMSAFGNQGQKELVQQELQGEFYEELGKQYEALKMGPQGALKRLVTERFMGSAAGDAGFQRMLGMGFGQFRGPGGFIPGAVGAGFTPEMAMQMGQGIMGAGGSTMAGREATFALQMQRKYDLTNAGGLMGTLGGALGGGQMTKEALINLYASGTAIGLDKSEFREENRKYLEGLAAVVARSGAKTMGDIARLSTEYSSFVADKTPLGIQAAQSAFGLYQQAATEQTGPRAVLRQASLMGNEAFGKLSMTTQLALSQLPPEAMTSTNQLVVAAANEAGVDPKDIIDMYQGAQMKSMMVFEPSKGEMLRQQALGAAGLGGSGLPQDLVQQLQTGAKSSYAAYLAGQPGMEALRKNPRLLEAFESGMEGKDYGAAYQAFREAKEGIGPEGAPTRPEDLMMAGQAQFEGQVNDQIFKFGDSLGPATDAVRQFAAALTDAALASQGASQQARDAARQDMMMSPQERALKKAAFNQLVDQALSPSGNKSSLPVQGTSTTSAPNSSSL